MRTLLCIAFVLLSTSAAQAQLGTNTPSNADLNRSMQVKIALLARGGTDSVILRWAPSKPAVWLVGNKVGYNVQRAVVGSDGRPGQFIALTDSVVKPWPYERWLAYAEAHPVAPNSDAPNYPVVAFTLLDQFGGDGPARDNYSSDELASIAERKAELEMRFGFAMIAVDRSADAADGLGLGYVDKTVKRGERYTYRVILAGSAGEYRVDTGMVTVVASPPTPLPQGAIIADGGDQVIDLRWPANGAYGSYFVDRSEDKGSSYKRMNRIPLVTLRNDTTRITDQERYRDSNTTNYKEYRYRVYGTTAFGDEVLVGEARGFSRDVTPPSKPFLPNPKNTAPREVRVVWTVPEPVTADLAGFRVARASSDTGDYTYITRTLPPSIREFVDTAFIEGGTNYYIVEATDTARNAIRSNSAYVTLIDSTPPGVPTWIDGRMDSTGVVTLRLHGRSEPDLMGYRIFRSNDPDHEFSLLLESFADVNGYHPRDSVFTDTVEIRTPTNKVYYRVTALDRNFNESALSQILAVRRPDVVPPVAPVIRDVGMTDSTVLLGFVPSTSADVAWHVLYRRNSEGAAWDSISRVGQRDTTYTDRAVSKNIEYWYAMRAVDSSALRSDLSPSVVARPYDSGTRPDVQNLTARYDATRRVVELRWDYPAPSEDYWFVIHRVGSGTVLRQYARVASTQRTFTDDAPLRREDGTAVYAVRVVSASGAQSRLEPTVQVQIGR